MTKMIYWLCDLAGIIGAVLFLYGIYLIWSLAVLLIVAGLMLMAWACRASYCLKQQPDTPKPDGNPPRDE